MSYKRCRARLLLFLIVAIVPSTLLATYPYLYFDPEDAVIQKETYVRYVLPQIRSIITDFFNMLRKNHPLQRDLITIYESTSKLETDYKEIITIINNAATAAKNDNGSTEIDSALIKKIQALYYTAQKTDLAVTSFENGKINFIDGSDPAERGSYDTDGEFEVLQYLTNMSDQSYRLIHILENALTSTDLQSLQKFMIREQIETIVHNLYIMSLISITAPMGGDLKTHFNFVLINYIEPLKAKVVPASNSNILDSRFEDFNMSWNSFNMKLSKGNIILSNNILKGIQIIHQRWVSILKIVLKKTLKNPPLK